MRYVKDLVDRAQVAFILWRLRRRQRDLSSIGHSPQLGVRSG